jgi:uncharacterized protein (DUF849 family)
VIVQACLNGSRDASQHPQLPVSLDDIVREAVGAVLAGANELHVHVRDDAGRESLRAEHVQRTVVALREHVPGTLIGISTGAWIESDEMALLDCIRSWQIGPDHASVNLSEANAPAVIEALSGQGIGVEAGLADVTDAQRLIDSDLTGRTLRILVEVDNQDDQGALSDADAILDVLRSAGCHKPVLLHGFDDTVWPLVKRAAALRFSTRVGFEDGLRLPDGSVANSNAELVLAAKRIYAAFGVGAH